MKTVFYVAEGLCNYLFAFWRLLQQIHTIPITIVQNGDSKLTKNAWQKFVATMKATIFESKRSIKESRKYTLRRVITHS